MGWTCLREKPVNVKGFIVRRLTWSSELRSDKVLDAALVGRRALYAAVETTYSDGKRAVRAVVCLVSFSNPRKHLYAFCYKDMSELDGPCARDCPERILKLLTPLGDEDVYGHGAGWRKCCWDLVERRKAARKATDFVSVHPIKFPNGASFSNFSKRPGRGNYLAIDAVREAALPVKLSRKFIDEGILIPRAD